MKRTTRPSEYTFKMLRMGHRWAGRRSDPLPVPKRERLREQLALMLNGKVNRN